MSHAHGVDAPAQRPLSLPLAGTMTTAGTAVELELVAGGFEFLEAPAWEASTASLLVADMDMSAEIAGVWRVSCDGTREWVVPHRRGIGGIVLHEDGGIILTGRTVAWKHSERTHALVELDDSWGHNRFSDLTTDRHGRIYVGSAFYG